MSSVVISGDTSGSVTLQAPTAAGSTVITLPSTSGTMLTTASTTGISGSAISSGTVAEAYGGTGTSTGYYGFKNRILNGGMVIDQRNAGASVTPNNSYTLDRWQGSNSQTGKYTVQQSSTAPTGFINSLLATSSSAYTVGASDIFALQQKIEGLNCADLAWGTANAATVTLSFWVRSSLTGTFGGSLQNNSNNRSYPFSYTISSANTWEQKTVTVTGDTTGTWLTTSGTGIIVTFSIGGGSTYSGTAGSWSANTYYSATGATSVVGTNAATWYVTGVQLEKGSTATSFDYRPYGTELALCQRYLPAYISSSTVDQVAGFGQAASTTAVAFSYTFPVTTRIPPTGISIPNSTYFTVSDGVTNTACTTTSFNIAGNFAANIQFNVASGLTQYRPYSLYANNAAAKILFTGCEL